MKNSKHILCREFNWRYTLRFLWSWRHYCDVSYSYHTVSQCSVYLPSRR